MRRDACAHQKNLRAFFLSITAYKTNPQTTQRSTQKFYFSLSA